MSVLSITPRDITYRLVRLRRLIVIASIFPVLGMIGSIIVFGGETWYFEPMNFLLVLAIWMMFICVYVVIFPFDWLEVLVMAFLLSLTLFGASYFSDLVALARPEKAGFAYFVAIVLMGIAIYVAFLSLTGNLPALGSKVKLSKLRYEYNARAEVPMDKLMAQILLKENVDTGFRKTSVAIKNGIFIVRRHLIFPNKKTFVPEETEFLSFAKVAGKGANTQVTEFFKNWDDTVSCGCTEEKFEEKEGITTYYLSEAQCYSNLYSYIRTWILDSQADFFTCCVDAANGEKPRAMYTRQYITSHSIIARWMVKNRPPV